MADIPIYELIALLKQDYPNIFALLSKPGVAAVAVKIMNDAANGKPWTDAQINAAIQATDYYKSVPADQRAWDILQAVDPATAGKKIADTKKVVDDAMAATGVQLDTTGGLSSPAFQFLNKAVQQGWDAARIRYELLALGGGHGGDVASAATTIKGLADDYGVPLSDQATMDWATKLAQGAITLDSVKGYLVEQAKSLFPALAGALDRGITVKQYADPYIQMAVQELGVNPSGISLTDQKWMKALNQVDPKTGQRTAMSLDQWLMTLRTDPSYGYDTTDKGRQDASQLATQLAAKFGVLA